MVSTDEWRQFATTVGALKEALAGVPDDTPVILEKDAEGNGYSPLSGVYTDCVYEAESNWSGEVHSTDDEDYEPDERDVRVVVLGPVN